MLYFTNTRLFVRYSVRYLWWTIQFTLQNILTLSEKFMTKQMEINGKQEKVFILQTWHLILLIVSLIFFAGISYGVSQWRIAEVERRQSTIEQWIGIHEKYTRELQGVRDSQFYEMQTNLRLIAQKLGIEYQNVSSNSAP